MYVYFYGNIALSMSSLPLLPFRHGGWIVDGFPFLREHWNAMIETASLPDTVICMEPDDGDNRILMKRFCETNGLPYPFEKETGEDEATEGNKVSGVMNIYLLL